MYRFPYECKVKKTGRSFVPTVIDYDNRQVWNQVAQTSGAGEWYGFEEVDFSKRDEFIDLTELESKDKR